MIGQSWIYDTIICLYAISILFYFFDFLMNDRKIDRLAFGLLTVVWALQTVFFILEMLSKNYLPVLTLFETLFFYSWILLTMSLLISLFFRVEMLVFFANVIGFAVLSFNVFTNREDISPVFASDLTSELLFIHITMALFSYGLFSLSAVFSVMYLLQNKMLKEKRWNKMLRRLPSLDQLDMFSFQLNIFGVPMLLLAIILGVIWANIKIENSFWFDPKVLMSLLVLLAYSSYLYQRVKTGWQGRRLALWNLTAFFTILLNYFVSGSLSDFHQWF